MEVTITTENIEQYRTGDLPLVVDLWATWCGPCRMIAPIVSKLAEEYDGKIVAGMYPQDQVKLAEKAGTNIFGSVVNTNTSKSFAWNAARSAVITKACVEAANIPVHANMGMGVGGIPMCELPPTDITGRAAKILIEIANIDGI